MVVRGVNCQCWGGMGSLWTVPGDQTKARGAERPEGVNNHAASLRRLRNSKGRTRRATRRKTKATRTAHQCISRPSCSSSSTAFASSSSSPSRRRTRCTRARVLTRMSSSGAPSSEGHETKLFKKTKMKKNKCPCSFLNLFFQCSALFHFSHRWCSSAASR